jgi:propionyl-CoA synthetase
MAGNCVGLGRLPVKHGSVTKPVPGWDLHVLDAAGRDVTAGEIGAIAMKLPLAPGSSPTLWNADRRFVDAYLTEFPGYYATADAGYIDEDGYVYVMTRTDDVINVAGHRLSTGAMEEVVAAHPDVAECAVIGIADPLKGQVPLGFIVLKAGTNTPHGTVSKEVLALIRERIGAVAGLKAALVVERLPKTRSGKILRGTMRHIADGEAWTMPATIDDPAILDEIADHLKEAGLAKAAG